MSIRRDRFSAETVVLAVLALLLVSACAYVCLSAHNWRADHAATVPVHASAALPPLPPALAAVAANEAAPDDASVSEAPAPAVAPDPVTPNLASKPVASPAPSIPKPHAAPHPTSVAVSAPPMPPLRPTNSHFAPDQFTAVYDLTAHTVYLPGGGSLEAHSGLGDRLDDPLHVEEADRGATPPHLYDLSLREQLFHGVQALRLNPVGGSDAIFGRAGLLAHSYMLGPNGDSNGCVSFKDYDAFLRAFQSGQVKRLVVVAGLK